jgi:hypothetical protein
MASIYRLGGALLLAAGVAACNSPVAKDEPPGTRTSVAAATRPADVALKVVKWPELERAIGAHKGKVVVLDVWAEY